MICLLDDAGALVYIQFTTTTTFVVVVFVYSESIETLLVDGRCDDMSVTWPETSMRSLTGSVLAPFNNDLLN